MNLHGRKIIVNKSSAELFQMMKTPEQYRNLMPDNLSVFEARDGGFRFGLKGMPEFSLKFYEIIENQKVSLKSENPNLDFTLTGTTAPLNAQQTEIQILFEGKFNPFVEMMAQKPLQNFIDTFTDKLEKI